MLNVELQNQTTIELLYYIFLCLIGIYLCKFEFHSSKIYSILTFIFFFIYSLITRCSGFDIDMNAYASSLEVDLFSVYYLREPVYWITSRYIYDAVQSPEITFIIFDSIAFLLVLKARKNIKLPQYFTFLFLLSFPSVMGMNNVYRQYLSCAFFLYFVSLIFTKSNFCKRFTGFLVSVLTHNVALLFSPLVFRKNESHYVGFRAIILCFVIVMTLPIAMQYKSVSDTGDVEIIAYIFLIYALLIFYCASYRMKLSGNSAYFFYFFIFIMFLVSVAGFFMGSAQSKRIAMFSLMILFVPLVISIEKNYKQKSIVRVFLLGTFVIPTLLFPSSLSMLLTPG